MFFDPKLWQFTEGVRGRMAATVVLGVVASLVGVLRLGLLGWLIGEIFAGRDARSLLGPALAVGAVMVARGLLEHWRTMVAHETAAAVQLTLRRRLYDKVVSLGPAFFGLQRTGDVLTSMVEGVEQLETYFGQYLPQLLTAAITPLAIFALAAFIDLPVALVLLGFTVFTLVAPATFQRWDSANSLRRSRAYRAFAAEFLDAVQGLATLSALGQTAARGRLLAAKAHEVFRATMWVLATNALTRGITDTGLAVGAAAVLGFGAWRVTQGQMDLGALLVFLMVGIEAFRPQRDLRSLLHQGMMGQAAAQGIMAVMDARPEVRAPEQPAPLAAVVPSTVQFDNVEFTYPGARRATYEGLTFTVNEGERVGFVGASGAGKSTIVKLALRFHDADRGAVRVAGHDVRELAPDDLYAQVAVVNQDTYLFHGTVADNLRVGRPEATRDELEQAARDANAHDFISHLPDGYATVVGERGIRLSGGQRQRIAIARALLRDAPILVLDEALSSVDAENEAIIQDALDRLAHGRTTLVFAHRLSSVIGADRILVLGEGQVVDGGTHDELMARAGVYRSLMGAQAEERGQRTDGALDITGETIIARPAEDALPGAGDVTAIEPTDAIVRAEGMGWMAAARALAAQAAPWRGKVALVFGLGVVRVVALIGVGALSALALAALKQDQPWLHYLLWLAVVAPAAGVLHWLESWFAHDMAFRMLSELRVALFAKLGELAPAYLVRRRTGDLVAMATHDVELVEYFFAHTMAPAFVAVLVPAAVVATLTLFGWPLALALAPFLVVVGVSPFLARRRIDALGSRAREALGDLNAHVVDSLQGLSEILAFRHAARRGAELEARIARVAALRLPFYRDLSRQSALLEVVTGMGGLAVVATGAVLIDTGALDASLLPLLTLLAMAAFLPVSEIAQIGRQLADTLGATRRLHAVHHEVPAVADVARDGGTPLPAPDRARGAALELDHVAFSYFGNDRLALRDVSFTAEPGETVALVGPSGAGKTTVAHLLMRFWDPDRGSIRLDGNDLRAYGLEDLRSHVAIVTQDTYLFNETLRENIALARPGADDAAIDAAVNHAALAEFVAALPDGLDTLVGERGTRLSGGQRQRVAIARAFLEDAPVLILDEATSHLDAVNERAVHDALQTLMRGRTTIVIAHRLSTVRAADRIVVLEGGRSVESGDHHSLLARNGLYARLIAHQLGPAAAAEE